MGFSEYRQRRMTRGFKIQAEQQSLISVDAAMKILEQKNLPLIVDHNKLKVSPISLTAETATISVIEDLVVCMLT